jgi:hypothetical protein
MTTSGLKPVNFPPVHTHNNKKNKKTIPVTGPGGLLGGDTLSIPYFLDNHSTDGDLVADLTHKPRSTLQEHYITRFLLEDK